MIHKSAVIWHPSNIYNTANIGELVSIGMFTEIGNLVTIGYKTRIGAHCFIPEGVTIEEDCFIGPMCCFTNDKYPPSPRRKWANTLVQKGASIGAGCTILCGVDIGRNATIGCGSVVTKSVPENEIWAGVPAKKLRDKPL